MLQHYLIQTEISELALFPLREEASWVAYP